MEDKSILATIWGLILNTIQGAWTGFQWPHAVFIISLVIIARFKPEISAAIARINKVGPVELIPPQPQIDPKTTDIIGGTVDKVAPAANNSGLKGAPFPPVPFPGTMKLTSENLDNEIGGLQPDEKLEYLKERLAHLRVAYDFEVIYSSIYGGQLELLNWLNQKPFNQAYRHEFEIWWVGHKAKFSGQIDNWNLDGYLHFLIFNGLVVYSSSGYSITAKGKEFLVWMVQMSRAFAKPW